MSSFVSELKAKKPRAEQLFVEVPHVIPHRQVRRGGEEEGSGCGGRRGGRGGGRDEERRKRRNGRSIIYIVHFEAWGHTH